MLNNSALILNAKKKSNLPVSSDPNFPSVFIYSKEDDGFNVSYSASNELETISEAACVSVMPDDYLCKITHVAAAYYDNMWRDCYMSIENFKSVSGMYNLSIRTKQSTVIVSVNIRISDATSSINVAFADLHKFMDAIGIFNGRSNELAFSLYQ